MIQTVKLNMEVELKRDDSELSRSEQRIERLIQQVLAAEENGRVMLTTIRILKAELDQERERHARLLAGLEPFVETDPRLTYTEADDVPEFDFDQTMKWH